MTAPSGPRAARTRQAIFEAFARLAFGRRYETIRTGDLIEASGVGRSTFYDHFSGKEAVLLASLDPVLVPMAEAATGARTAGGLRLTLHHLWDRRALARTVFAPAVMPKLQRKLAALIEARQEPADPLQAVAASAAQLALLRAWLLGEVSCTAETLARRLSRLAGRPSPS